MNKIKILLLASLIFSTQTLKPNYFFKQVASGIIIGIVAGYLYKKADNQITALSTASLIGTKFFYDLLTSKNGAEVFKAFVSFPFYTGVAFTSAFVTTHIV